MFCYLRCHIESHEKSRDREKGRQATGPLWLHLAAQAKNLADQLNLQQLLEVLKLFCSVRYEDYELYMRLLGEVARAGQEQLCQLLRLMARRRLRERNYARAPSPQVDMAVAHLLSKIRFAEELLSGRLLVKTANALAALECRSQPKFVEHFNRHFEHRIEELDAELCCMVSPVFLVNYMGDALRRAFLKRCAEVQAGFTGGFPIRSLACIELALRKEQHSLVASLPPFVVRYLEKVRAQTDFDKYGSVVLPTTVAPDGPRGDERQELSVALLRKAATTPGSSTGDVFSSEMHRDVSACLGHLGIEHENGVVTGPYLLDVVAKDMVNPSRRIVYEVNSPHHFYEGTKD
ncbi:PCNA [Symbiodinium natans]|uniref:PCNA protein n=1 Tax=Symbiodinium natans TaxID=878477 RepID=A0A812RG04_9DINO|nr:PCNA [Symbiodinium natans]